MSPDNIAFKVPAAHIVAEDTDLGIERTRNCFAADVIRGYSLEPHP